VLNRDGVRPLGRSGGDQVRRRRPALPFKMIHENQSLLFLVARQSLNDRSGGIDRR
jgi:hypothetical protein